MSIKSTVAAALVVSAAILGGAVEPLPAMVVGVVCSLLLALLILDWQGPLTGDHVAFLALVVWGTAVALARGSAGLENKETLAAWIAAATIWACCRLACQSARLGALTILAAGTLMLALIVIFESYGFGAPRVGGLLANPNTAAALILPTLPVFWLLGTGRRWRTLVMPVALGVGATGALLTGSRAALLALLIMIILGVPAGRLRKICIVGGLIGSTLLITWRFTSHADSLAWHRTAIWGALFRLTAEQPIMGCGPGGMADATGAVRITHPHGLAHHQHRIGSAESTPLGVLVRLGLIGLIIFGAGIFAWLARLRSQDYFSCPVRRGIVGAIFAFCLVHDLMQTGVILWWWAALVGLTETPPQRAMTVEKRSSMPRQLAAAAACALMLWLMVRPAHARSIWFSSPSSADAAAAAWRAEPLYLEPVRWRVHDLLNLRRWTWKEAGEALYWSRLAVQTDPGKAHLWTDLGRVSARGVTELGAWPDAVETTREAFATACDLEPKLPWSLLEWAAFERSLGQPGKAHELALRAVENESNFIHAWLFLARIEIDMGRLDAARRKLEKAMVAKRLGPTAGTAYERALMQYPNWQLTEIKRILSPAASPKSPIKN